MRLTVTRRKNESTTADTGMSRRGAIGLGGGDPPPPLALQDPAECHRPPDPREPLALEHRPLRGQRHGEPPLVPEEHQLYRLPPGVPPAGHRPAPARGVD